jgi:hypothetical protein
MTPGDRNDAEPSAMIAAAGVEREDAVSFLIEEYKAFQQVLSENEATGERRVNFFVGFVTSVMAALGALAAFVAKGPTKSGCESVLKSEHLVPLIGGAAFALLVIGGVTLLRIIHRNRTTDDLLDHLRVIRERFLQRDLADTLRERSARDTKCASDKYKPPRGRSLLNGGLAQMVAVMNSMLVAVVCLSLSGKSELGACATGNSARQCVDAARWQGVPTTEYREYSEEAQRSQGAAATYWRVGVSVAQAPSAGRLRICRQPHVPARLREAP